MSLCRDRSKCGGRGAQQIGEADLEDRRSGSARDPHGLEPSEALVDQCLDRRGEAERRYAADLVACHCQHLIRCRELHLFPPDSEVICDKAIAQTSITGDQRQTRRARNVDREGLDDLAQLTLRRCCSHLRGMRAPLHDEHRNIKSQSQQRIADTLRAVVHERPFCFALRPLAHHDAPVHHTAIMAHNDKTQATRMLDAKRIAYRATVYDATREFHSAEDAAQLIGAPAEAVYKTLVVLRETAGRERPLLVMVASHRQIDLRVLAKSLGEKKLTMASQRDAERLTGLQVGGIAALALLNRPFDVVIDEAAELLEKIHVSAGQRGIDVELRTEDLVSVTGARFVVATAG